MAIPFALPLQAPITDENKLATSENIDAAINDIDLTGYLKNTATTTNSVTIAGRVSSADKAVNVGAESNAQTIGGTAIGFSATSYGENSTAVGQTAYANAEYSIQIGEGANNAANTMNVGLSNTLNVQLLDANGQIPAERLTNVLGDIETLLAAL